MRDAHADQATGLRALFGQRARTTLSVAGDGATAVTLNLAAALARIGQQVLVIDTMKGEAATALGLRARFELAHVLAGDRQLRDVLLAGPEGVALLPATRGLPRLVEGSGPWQDRVAAWLDPYGTAFNVWLVNGLPPGGSTADAPVLFVLAPTADALTAAYAQMKTLARVARQREFRIVVRRAKSETAALATYRNMADTAREFLSARLDYCGYIPRDDSTALADVRSPCGHAFARLAESLLTAGAGGMTAAAA
jgi:flagellar biosynthesis protein FlhG